MEMGSDLVCVKFFNGLDGDWFLACSLCFLGSCRSGEETKNWFWGLHEEGKWMNREENLEFDLKTGHSSLFYARPEDGLFTWAGWPE